MASLVEIRAARAAALRVAAALAVLLLAACTVDAGAVPDAGPCFAPPAGFVDHVWLEYLDRNQCATRLCHGFDDGEGNFRLRPPFADGGTTPDPSLPVTAWPLAWRENYYETAQLLDCANPPGSRLLTLPEGRAEFHPPGDVVEDHAGADALITAWIQGTL